MIMLKKKMQKLLAVLILTEFMGSASLPIVAEAAYQHPLNQQEKRILNPKPAHNLQQHAGKQNSYHDNLRERDDHEDHDNYDRKQAGEER